MHFFTDVPLASPDPILGLNQAFNADLRPNKVNLGVGAYKTDELKPYVLSAVQKAEALILEKSFNKEYLPIEGAPNFLSQVTALVLGEKIERDRLFVAQTIGGTGGLRAVAQFLVEQTEGAIYISTPTWPNHGRIFSQAGLRIGSYSYYDPQLKNVNFSHLRQAFSKLPPESIVVLHACCHNPTGCDLSIEQWKELSLLFQEKQLIPFFDFAYQGFGKSPSADAEPIRLFVKQGLDCLIATSFSKNFGLYGERVGALFVVCEDRKSAEAVGSQVKGAIRGLYSNPPAHGARIISTILEDTTLRQLWLAELETMRKRIEKMRDAFVNQLLAVGIDFTSIKNQRGMFAYTGLSSGSVDRLIEEFAIYLPKDGRVSLSGLNEENLPYVIQAFSSVMQ